MTSSRRSCVDQLMTIAEVADLLNVGERWVRRAVAEQRIEIVKVGHYVRFTRRAVLRFIEDNMRPEGRVR